MSWQLQEITLRNKHLFYKVCQFDTKRNKHFTIMRGNAGIYSLTRFRDHGRNPMGNILGYACLIISILKILAHDKCK